VDEFKVVELRDALVPDIFGLCQFLPRLMPNQSTAESSSPLSGIKIVGFPPHHFQIEQTLMHEQVTYHRKQGCGRRYGPAIH
jgi:hypothetical protein